MGQLELVVWKFVKAGGPTCIGGRAATDRRGQTEVRVDRHAEKLTYRRTE